MLPEKRQIGKRLRYHTLPPTSVGPAFIDFYYSFSERTPESRPAYFSTGDNLRFEDEISASIEHMRRTRLARNSNKKRRTDNIFLSKLFVPGKEA